MDSLPKKEALTIEFKSDRKNYSDDDLIDEIVGMVNTEGGTLYLGMEDDGTVTGVASNAHKDIYGLCALIANKTVPSISARAKIIETPRGSVMQIQLPKSRSVIASSKGRILRRRLKADGTPENIPMYPYEITSRLSDLRLLDFSIQPLEEATIQDFDPVNIERLKAIIQNRDGDKALLGLSTEALLSTLHITTRVGDNTVPTLAGMLLIGRETRMAELVPTMETVFQVLQGTDIVLNRSFRKPIIELIDIFDEYMHAYNPEKEMEYGFFRLSVPEFSVRAFREGLINAFAHRDYSMLGRVRVQIRDDSLTISNPGGFIEGITVENLIYAEPEGRNPGLSDALKRIGLVEKTGRGIDRIFEGSILFGRPCPDYSRSTSRTVELVIPRSKPDIKFSKMLMDEQNRRGKPLSIEDLLILSAIKENGRQTMKQLQSVTHIHPVQLRQTLEELEGVGLLEELVFPKARVFVFNGKFYDKQGGSPAYTKRSGSDWKKVEEKILHIGDLQNGILTKQDVVEKMRVSPGMAYQYLKKLQREGRIELVNAGKYARYRVRS